MDNNTPLSKFKRQPKLYIDLPSKGIWYPKGKLNKFEEMEVYSMTANDEIAIKTPDALYTGQAITKVIQSCVPDILDPWLVPMTDIDYILASIRLASYGQDIQLSSTCKECGNEDNYTMEIQRILDFVQTLTLEEVLTIQDFKFYLRPLTYKEYTQIQQSNIQLQRTLYQSVSKMDEGDEKQKELIDKLNTLNFTSEKSEINNGLISVEDYPITYDNNLYFSFKTDEKINICQIYESENKNISKLFSSEEIFNYTIQNIDQVDYNILDKQDIPH